MKQESIETLKTKIATNFRKHGDKQALIVMDRNPRTYTGNQVADEIEQETEFGVECIDTVINLTVDLLSRDKMKYEPRKENIPQTEDKIDTNIPVKLSKHQINTLNNLCEERCWRVGTTKADGRTMHALYGRGLVKIVRYFNGEFWEMTDKGFDELDRVKPL